MHYKYSKDDLSTYKEIIHSNILQNINLIVHKMKSLGVKLENQQNQEFFDLIENLSPEDYLVANTLYNREMATKISTLTSDKNFQNVFRQNCNHICTEGLEYILKHLYRMSDQNFVPSQTDIMVSRIKTTGIVESVHQQNFERFGLSKDDLNIIRLVDVGGARNERKKWIYCFNNVSMIFFCASLLDFCRVLSFFDSFLLGFV
jgi:guanine nucleotide-binding protein G(i) subunit alpha